LSDVFTDSEIESARTICELMLADATTASIDSRERGAPAYGARNLLRSWPAVIDLVRNPALAEPLLRILGKCGGLVRGLYFDKPPGHTWALPWHRDMTVAVKSHGVIGRFRKPTLKAGVPHMEAPRELLESMVTARIHLDDMTDDNGPLRVMPKSHRQRSTADVDDHSAISLHCKAGDVLLMRPLLCHASAHGNSGHDGHRRVVHLEFAPNAELPDEYEWHDFVRIQI
jgi:hypothetical protein